MPIIRRRDIILHIISSATAFGHGGRLFAATPEVSGSFGVGAWHTQNLAAANYLTLPISINGTSLEAMIDSGASRSVVRPDIAFELGLPVIGVARATTVTGQISGILHRVADLNLEVDVLHDLDMASYDLSRVEKLAGRSIAVILGQDILREIDIEIEFGNDRARFRAPLGTQISTAFTKLDLQGKDGSFPSLVLRLESGNHHRAIMDLGNASPLSMSRNFAEASGLLRGRPVSTTLTFGVDGPSVGPIITIREAQIGPFTLRQIPVCVVDDWKPTESISVGWPFFASFHAVACLGRRALWLKEGGGFGLPFPRDRSGLGGQRLINAILVRHVALNSPAWNAGMQPGDAIVAVDGHRIDPTYPPPGVRFGEKPAGTSLRLTLADGRNIVISLRDYF